MKKLIAIILLIGACLLTACGSKKDKDSSSDEAKEVNKNSYERGGTFEYGKFRNLPLKWRVLDITGDEALIITDHAIIMKSYNDTLVDVTWEECTLRRWLNNDFYNEAFSVSEKSAIVTSGVPKARNEKYNRDSGSMTKDNVYILSELEAKIYTDEGTLNTKPEYDYSVDGEINYYWWLRTPGYKDTSLICQARYDCEGRVDYTGMITENSSGYTGGVRPVMTVKLEEIKKINSEK